jgi:hypothetical protein
MNLKRENKYENSMTEVVTPHGRVGPGFSSRSTQELLLST